MLQQAIDSVDIGVDQFNMVLSLGGRWVGQLADFPSSSLPRQALPWLTQGNYSKEPVFLFLGLQIQAPLHSLPGPALLFCPARVQGLFSCVL